MNMVLGTEDFDPKLQIWTVCPSTQIGSNFYEMLHSQQMEHANYGYNTRYGLERSRVNCLRMIVDRKIRLSF